jgi:hypothetical protein
VWTVVRERRVVVKKILLCFALLVPQVASAQVVVRPVRVVAAPPAVRVEVRPAAPSRRHVWIAGYWGWRGGKHMWFDGHWALPPGVGFVWQPARWEQVNGAYMFYEGHWAAAEAPVQEAAYQPPPPPVQAVIVGTPPPAPIEEVQPQIPFEGAVWIPGYWYWNGVRHVWIGGRWSAQPAGHVWMAPRWEHRGEHWVHHPGYWHER